MSETQWVLDEAFMRMKNQRLKDERVNLIKAWVNGDETRAAAFKKRYGSLGFNLRRGFWLFMKEMNANDALAYALRFKTMLKKANSPSGLRFKAENGLKCTVKRLDKTEYADMILRFERQQIAAAQANGVWFTPEWDRFLLFPEHFKYFIFTYETDGMKFGLVYLLASTPEKVSLKFPSIVDAAARGKPVCKTYDFSYAFCEDKIFHPYCSEANAIKEAIRRGLSPKITFLIYNK